MSPFDLETYLTEWRRESRADVLRIETTFAAHDVLDTQRFADLHSAIKPLQSTNRAIRWLIGAVVSAILMGGVDVVANHLHWSKP